MFIGWPGENVGEKQVSKDCLIIENDPNFFSSPNFLKSVTCFSEVVLCIEYQ